MMYVSILRHPTEREPLVEKLACPASTCGPDIVVIEALAVTPLFPRGAEFLSALPTQLQITHPTGATVVVCITRLYNMISIPVETTPQREVVEVQPEQQAPVSPPIQGKPEMAMSRQGDPNNIVEI